ncbi:MAG: universal stress protein [Sedimentibacter sp.]
MKKILVPLDGSDVSLKVAIKATEVAKSLGCELTFMTVALNPIPSKIHEYEQFWDIELNAMLDVIKKIEDQTLDDVIEKLDLSDIKFDKKSCLGETSVEILKEAKEGNYDLIVMGRRGHSNIKRFFLGSITQKVISDSPCPVLVVNE